jgi:hypothetical protein
MRRILNFFQIYKIIFFLNSSYQKFFKYKFFISYFREKPIIFWNLLNFILDQKKPKFILELGSGKSTTYFLKYISKNKKSNFLTLEHHYLWYRKQLKYIKKNFGKKFCNCLRYSRIVDDWYDFDSDDKYDFILVDGPNEHSFLKRNISKRDSSIAINFFSKKIKNCRVLIVDDTHRTAEKNIIKRLNLNLKKAVKITYNKSNNLTIFSDTILRKKIISFLKKRTTLDSFGNYSL